ncbi:amidase domain-containing protein [Baia soyae]|uniref:Putative amidase-like protein n=1 Tax=Baia soyae TaxID=1544746 RepID=A0A4R2RV98_9BACL|nr:amidase domain-containing protein [Baia soyae]TCP67353.1 putative amidase-like protein [Baia soyae]
MPMEVSTYVREQAVAYAKQHWNNNNPAYLVFTDNCTNFISQCLYAGHFPMEGQGNPQKGWWYMHRGGKNDRWSDSWAVAHSLYWYLRESKRVQMRQEARQLELGDVICYDWEGDGKWNHNTIVTGFDENGEPLVHAQTYPSAFRPWRYLDSPGWTPRTRYAFFHIVY